MDQYKKCIDFWDRIFEKERIVVPVNSKIGIEKLDYGIAWLCQGVDTILDFGCGNGVMLFYCALNGTKNHIGIDASQQAIHSAISRSKQMKVGNYQFINGGVDWLKQISDKSVDGVILSNIIDNLYPEDALLLLKELKRILKAAGRILVKLNQYLTSEQINEYQIKIIKDNLLDDGLLLWNNTTAKWREILSRDFIIKEYHEIYYQQHEQINRMFLLENRS